MSALKKFFMIFLVLTTIAILSILLFFKLNTSTENFANFSSQTEPTKEQLPTIIIDAGHGGEDGGAIGKNGAYEKDINLMISKKLKALLDAKNIPCVLTRSTDILLYDKTSDYEGKKKKLDLLARKEFAEKYENAIFISIHQNSYPLEKYSGFQVYYSPNNEASLRLAPTLRFSLYKKKPEADASGFGFLLRRMPQAESWTG